ncbi:MAG: hypothetical protein AB8F94_07625 [Saprospiraceae bacterium]
MIKYSLILFFICFSTSSLEKTEVCDLKSIFVDEFHLKEIRFLEHFTQILDKSAYDDKKGYYIKAIFFFNLKNSNLKIDKVIIRDLKMSFTNKKQIEKLLQTKMEKSIEQLLVIIDKEKIDNQCQDFIYQATFRLCS